MHLETALIFIILGIAHSLVTAYVDETTLYKPTNHAGELLPNGMIIFKEYIVTGAQDNFIKVWDVATGQLKMTLKGHRSWVSSFCIIDDHLYSSGQDGSILRWDFDLWDTTASLSARGSLNVIIAYNQQVIAASSQSITIYNSDLTFSVMSLSTLLDEPKSLLVTGDELIVGFASGRIRKFDLVSGTQMSEFVTSGYSQAPVISLHLWMDTVLSISTDKRLMQWERDGSLIRVLIFAKFLRCGWLMQDRLFIGEDSGLYSVSLNNGFYRQKLTHERVFTGATVNNTYIFHNDYSYMIRSRADMTIIWQQERTEIPQSINGNDNYIFVGMYSGTLTRYSVAAGTNVTITAHYRNIRSITSNNDIVATGGEDKVIRIWSAETGTKTMDIEFNEVISSIQLVGEFVYVTGSITIGRVNHKTGEVRTFSPQFPGKSCTSLAIVGDRVFVAGKMSDFDDAIFEWVGETTMTQMLFTTYSIFQIVSFDGFIFSCAYENLVRQFAVEPWKQVKEFRASGSICSLFVTSQFVFGGGCYTNSGEIVQWSRATTYVIRTYSGHLGTYGIWIIGRRLYSFGSDGIIKSYNVPDIILPISSGPRRISTRRITSSSSFTENADEGREQISALEPGNVISTSVGILVSLAVLLTLVAIVLLFTYWKRRQMKSNVYKTPSKELLRRSDAVLGSRKFEMPTLSTPQDVISLNSHMTTISKTYTVTAHELSIPVFMELEDEKDFKRVQLLSQGGEAKLYIFIPLSGRLKAAMSDRVGVLKIYATSTQQMHQRSLHGFLQETGILRKYRDQPHFVRFYGYSNAPCALCLKFYKLGDLDRYINKRDGRVVIEFPYSKTQVLILLKHVAIAVSIMHRDGIIHGDLKPANVLLEETAQHHLAAAVSDFGLSRIVNKDSVMVSSFIPSDIRGASMFYASPQVLERFKNLLPPSDLWKADDVYAIGIIICEMLVRRRVWPKFTARQ